MQIMIDIPKHIYEHIKEVYEHSHTVEATYSYIYHGIPLPKGHGRLIDVNDIKVIELEDSLHIIRHEKGDEIDVHIDAPTIIEADTESENME